MISIVAIHKTLFKWSSVSLVRKVFLVNFIFENKRSLVNVLPSIISHNVCEVLENVVLDGSSDKK